MPLASISCGTPACKAKCEAQRGVEDPFTALGVLGEQQSSWQKKGFLVTSPNTSQSHSFSQLSQGIGQNPIHSWSWGHVTHTEHRALSLGSLYNHPRKPGAPSYDCWHWKIQQFLTSRTSLLKFQILKLLIITDVWLFDNIQLCPSSWKGLSFGGTFRMRSLNSGTLHWVLVTLLENTETREEDS